MPTKTTTRIPPRTRSPRRRLPSPLARPSHERVQFSDFSEDKKLFPLVVSRNGDTQILDKRSTRLSCVRILYNNPSSYFFYGPLALNLLLHVAFVLLRCTARESITARFFFSLLSCFLLFLSLFYMLLLVFLTLCSVLFLSILSIPHFSVRAFGRTGNKRIEGLGIGGQEEDSLGI
jgi:hypothetical protein